MLIELPMNPHATVWSQPTEPTVASLVEKAEVIKALSQLTSVIVGGGIAKKTNHLAESPVARVDACIQEALAEFQKKLSDDKAATQLQRKLSSLASLRTLSTLFNEVEFDD